MAVPESDVMNACRLSDEATQDINDIWTYIAADNLAAADRLVRDIRNASAMLAESPTPGHFRRDLTSLAVRFYTVRKIYLIVYEPETKPLVIARVLHGARHAADILRA